MRLKILISYHYHKKQVLAEMLKKHFTEPYPEIFVDSGAFSAVTQGVEINIQEYARWLKSNMAHITTYANLDVIGNAEETWANQKTLEAEGLRPLPAFHTGEDWSHLERYIDEYPYVALGGLVPFAKGRDPIYMAWVLKCFKMAKDKTVYHGFGVTNWEALKSFPWYSVDSTSWGAGFRFGTVPMWNEQAKNFTKYRLGSRDWYKCGDTLRAWGFEPDDFAVRSRYKRENACAIAALSYQMAEEYLQTRHGKITMPGNTTRDSGLLLHLANANVSRLSAADHGIKLYLADTTGMADVAKANNTLTIKQSEVAA
jgi:hypothetical protein